jgi:hypothetical protein
MNNAIAQSVSTRAQEMALAQHQVAIDREHPNYELAVRFNRHYNRIATKVLFNKDWENGTGYLDGIVTDKALKESLKPGEMATSVDPHMRKIILIGTRAGTVGVFQRYGNEDVCDSAHIVHAPTMLYRMKLVDAHSSPLTWANANQIFGDFDTNNLGTRMEKLAEYFTTGIDPTMRLSAADKVEQLAVMSATD